MCVSDIWMYGTEWFSVCIFFLINRRGFNFDGQFRPFAVVAMSIRQIHPRAQDAHGTHGMRFYLFFWRRYTETGSGWGPVHFRRIGPGRQAGNMIDDVFFILFFCLNGFFWLCLVWQCFFYIFLFLGQKSIVVFSFVRQMSSCSGGRQAIYMGGNEKFHRVNYKYNKP